MDQLHSGRYVYMVARWFLRFHFAYLDIQILFLILGLVTVAWGILLFFLMPDSPLTARFLTPSQREFASLRPKKFLHTTQTKKLDKTQIIEALKDVKTWWVMCFAFVACVPNGGISSVSIFSEVSVFSCLD